MTSTGGCLMNLPDRIREAATRAPSAFYRLVLVVGQAQSGKSSALREVGRAQDWPMVNVNLHLAERLLELTKRQRAISATRLVGDLVRAADGAAVVLDNIELLFDPELAVDPLRLLQGLARERAIVVAWPGTFDGMTLTYAKPGHPESRRYSQPDAIIVVAAESGGSGHYQEQA